MTLAELRADCYRLLGDNSAAPWWTAAEATHALNVAQRLFAASTLCIERTGQVAAAGGSPWLNAAALSDFLAPLRVTLQGGRRLEPRTFDGLSAEQGRWQSDSGEPTAYALRFPVLAVWPYPANAATFDLLYAATPAALSADGDIPEIPDEDHGPLARGAAYLLALKAGGSILADARADLEAFQQAAQRRAAIVRARAQALAWDTLPFERKGVR
jgi:hypothetical protein